MIKQIVGFLTVCAIIIDIYYLGSAYLNYVKEKHNQPENDDSGGEYDATDPK